MSSSLAIDYSQPDPRIVGRMRRAGIWTPAPSIVISMCVVFGWLFRADVLTAWLPAYSRSRFVPSVIGLLLNLAIVGLYLVPERKMWIRGISILALLVTTLMFVEYLFPIDFGIDQPFHRIELPSFENPTPGRMSPNGAFITFVFALATIALTFRGALWTRLAQYLAVAGTVVAFAALMGYAYSIESLYGFGDYNAMSLAGAISNLLLAAGLLFVRPDDGIMRMVTLRTPAGVLARRMYFAVLIIPPILGSIALGLERLRVLDAPGTIATIVMSAMVTFSVLIAITSLTLERTDLRRREAELESETTRERLRDLSGHVQTLQEEERIRIAREVHDELGQSLTALKMDVAMLKQKLPQSDETDRRTATILALVDSTIKTVQRISHELRPGVLDDLGLAAAIEWQAHEFEERSGIICDVSIEMEDVPVDQRRSTAIFRIFQETLTNIARHAHASEVEVRLTRANGHISLSVVDDGVGLDEALLTNAQSLGLMGMRERAKLLGGSVTFRSAPGEGATVLVEIPMDEARAVVTA